MVITYDDDWRLADKIRAVGYEIDSVIDYKFSIIVIPKHKIDFLKNNGFSFAKNVLEEGVVL